MHLVMIVDGMLQTESQEEDESDDDLDDALEGEPESASCQEPLQALRAIRESQQNPDVALVVSIVATTFIKHCLHAGADAVIEAPAVAEPPQQAITRLLKPE